MIEIWNTFCEDISKNKSVKEKVFEKNIVKSFLQELGWSHYKRNLKEQLGLYKGKWRPDFVFYLNNDETNKEIILELKKPEHKQRKADIEQIEAYMKLTDCRFGLYFGEKLEVFYLMDVQGKRSAVSVTNIDWTSDNLAGSSLIKLLSFQTYDRQKLESYCRENIEANDKIEFWKTAEGQEELYDAVVKHCHLSEAMVNNLRHILKFQIQNLVDEEASSPKPVETKPATPAANDDIIDDFRTFAEESVGKNTARNYIRHLKGGVSEFFTKIIDHTAESIFSINNSSELKDCIATLKGNNEFMKSNKDLRYFLTASLTKYLEFLESMEGGLSSEKTEAKNQVKNTGQENPVHFSMKYGVADAKLDFYPKTKKYVIKADSTIATETKNYCADKVADLRKTVMADSAKSESRGESYILLEDIVLPDSINTPSAAAAFCNGGTADGPKRWKDENGKTHPKEWWK